MALENQKYDMRNDILIDNCIEESVEENCT